MPEVSWDPWSYLLDWQQGCGRSEMRRLQTVWKEPGHCVRTSQWCGLVLLAIGKDYHSYMCFEGMF